jgi:beta-lactamase regulating signal transducer with metallopeptidase domain
MHTFWEIIVSNSLVVTVLAVILALVGRTWKNPVVLHFLWVMVLLKFVTPPLVILPVPVTPNRQLPAPQPQEARQRSTEQSPAAVSREAENGSVVLSAPEQREAVEGSPPPSVAPIEVASAVTDPKGRSWTTVLAWSWVAGIALVGAGQAYRILRLRRLLRGALPASPPLHGMAEEMGRRLGLSWAPEVLLVPVRLSPMVWSPGGRPCLILPAALFARLDPAAQKAIVAHELAHIRRRDHWVRLLELAVSTLFWWHPVVWWAGRKLRELEEQCCDSMVLGAVPNGGRAYASALVDTLDYLSERSMVLPPIATGANTLSSLSRRIKMLKHPSPVQPLTVGRLLLWLAVATVPMAVAFVGKSSLADDRLRSVDNKQDPGHDSFVAQADKNQETGQPAVAKPAKDKTLENRHYETWRIAMHLEASKQLPSAVQWAIYDQDPVPAFKARFKKLRGIYQEQLRGAATEAAREDKRKGWMAVQWDWGFKEIPGDRLYLLTSDDPHPFESNGLDGKKWIVTKARKTKGKLVCWCLPVAVKYGEETKVTLTEKNDFDLGAAVDSAMRDTATPEDKKIEEWARKTWRMQLTLRFPGAAPLEVTYAVFDKDPVPEFKAAVKKWQANRKGDRLEKEVVKGDERQEAMATNWWALFKKVRGDRLYQLKSSRFATLASNEAEGKKWIVTKLVEIKGKSVCWCLPVEVKTGETIKVTLTGDNVFDLGSAFDGALRESEAKK